MPEEKSPLGKPRADPVSLASGKPHLVRLSLFGFGLSELGYGYRTTYLYLTEAYWDSEKPSTGFSSYTAFQMLVDAMSGEITERWYNKPTKFGFVNQDHPIVKLEKLGGIATGTRKITSLYRKRYMSDDASMLIDGVSYRLNDLVGYPIFIANSA